MKSSPDLKDLLALYSSSKDIEQVDSLRLAQLPPRLKDHPSPCLTRPEIHDFLFPLLGRGWSLEFRTRPQPQPSDEPSNPDDCGCSPPEVSSFRKCIDITLSLTT